MFISDEQNRDSITIISDGELYQSLLRALPLIASVTGGYATITNRQGVRLVTVDSEGVEQTDLATLRCRFGPDAGSAELGFAHRALRYRLLQY